MINLLPPFARKQIVREYWIRVLVVAFCSWSILAILIAIMFLPVYISLNEDVQLLSHQADDALLVQEQITAAEQTFARTNEYVAVLSVIDAKKPFTFYVLELERLAGQTVLIEEVHVRDQEGVIAPISLRAVADTRQTLIGFLEAIQDNVYFGEVDMPLSSLAQSENIRFSVEVPVLKE